MTQPTNPDYHWTPKAMRAFLEALAETGLVTDACAAADKSRRAAYNLRFRAEGRAFALGWEAALLVARACLADTLMERAMTGCDTITTRDPEAHRTVTTRVDNRLGAALLDRLDRLTGTTDTARAGSDAALARIIAQDFWCFLDLVERGGEGSEAALFVAARTPADTPAPGCELADEDEPEAEPDPNDPEVRASKLGVHYSKARDEFYTDFPPPEGFTGEEHGQFGYKGYRRDLTPEEEVILRAIYDAQTEPFHRAARQAYQDWCNKPEVLRKAYGLDAEPANDADGDGAEEAA